MLCLSLNWNLRSRCNRISIYLGDQRKRSQTLTQTPGRSVFVEHHGGAEAVFTWTVIYSNNNIDLTYLKHAFVPFPALAVEVVCLPVGPSVGWAVERVCKMVVTSGPSDPLLCLSVFLGDIGYVKAE